MYDNNMIMSLKQKKRKFEPRIKLNLNPYLQYFFFCILQGKANKIKINVTTAKV